MMGKIQLFFEKLPVNATGGCFLKMIDINRKQESNHFFI